MPPSAAPTTVRLEPRAFAEDVAYYLSLTPRQLPSHYLYDALGSALFDAICRLPWYPITRAEQALLARHAHDILSPAGSVSTLVELGPGRGGKLATLVEAADPGRAVTVHLVDVSAEALDAARQALGVPGVARVVPHLATYEAGLAAAVDHRSAGGTLVLFLGSNIGNFDPAGADALLRTIRGTLAAGDRLLIGTDLVKPAPELLLAYDDPLGVTAAFNKNLLVRVNRELGGDFDVERFAHRAIWNAAASRVEMHLVSTRAQRVRVPASDLDILFEEGEAIWTESSYKYVPDQIVAMLARAAFTRIEQWTADAFALTLAGAS